MYSLRICKDLSIAICVDFQNSGFFLPLFRNKEMIVKILQKPRKLLIDAFEK